MFSFPIPFSIEVSAEEPPVEDCRSQSGENFFQSFTLPSPSSKLAVHTLSFFLNSQSCAGRRPKAVSRRLVAGIPFLYTIMAAKAILNHDQTTDAVRATLLAQPTPRTSSL
jgi:hypothetical protein